MSELMKTDKRARNGFYENVGGSGWLHGRRGGGGGGLFKFKGLENVLSHILNALFAIGTKLVRINVSRT